MMGGGPIGGPFSRFATSVFVSVFVSCTSRRLRTFFGACPVEEKANEGGSFQPRSDDISWITHAHFSRSELPRASISVRLCHVIARVSNTPDTRSHSLAVQMYLWKHLPVLGTTWHCLIGSKRPRDSKSR